MIEDAKRSIAFLCPVCRQSVILERTVFQLAASGSRLPCPCGKSALTVSLMGDQVRLTVPCLFCEQEHTVSCSTAAFLQEKTLAFSCANSGLDCCYVGEEASVFAAMRRLEETVDVLESEAGAQGTFLNDLVMEEILGEIMDVDNCYTSEQLKKEMDEFDEAVSEDKVERAEAIYKKLINAVNPNGTIAQMLNAQIRELRNYHEAY